MSILDLVILSAGAGIIGFIWSLFDKPDKD